MNEDDKATREGVMRFFDELRAWYHALPIVEPPTQPPTLRERLQEAWWSLPYRWDRLRWSVGNQRTRLIYRLRGQRCQWKDCRAYAEVGIALGVGGDQEVCAFCTQHVGELFHSHQISVS